MRTKVTCMHIHMHAHTHVCWGYTHTHFSVREGKVGRACKDYRSENKSHNKEFRRLSSPEEEKACRIKTLVGAGADAHVWSWGEMREERTR